MLVYYICLLLHLEKVFIMSVKNTSMNMLRLGKSLIKLTICVDLQTLFYTDGIATIPSISVRA